MAAMADASVHAGEDVDSGDEMPGDDGDETSWRAFAENSLRSEEGPEVAAAPAAAPAAAAPAAAPAHAPAAAPNLDAPDGLCISELLHEHAAAIAELKEAVAESSLHFDPARHDELWRLRFLLSHKLRVSEARDAMCAALKLRAEHDLDRIASVVTTEPFSAWEARDEILETVPLLGVYTHWPDKSRGPIHLSRGGMNLRALRHKLPQLQTMLMWENEFAFQICDAVARRTGRLLGQERTLSAAIRRHKLVRIFDTKGFVVRRQLSLRVLRRLSANTAEMQVLYPQMLGVQFFTHMPHSMRAPYDHLILPLLPRRVAAKTRVLDPTLHAAELEALCRWVARDTLPRYLGGAADMQPETEWEAGNHGLAPPALAFNEWLAQLSKH